MSSAARRPAQQLPPPITADEFFVMPDVGVRASGWLSDGHGARSSHSQPFAGRIDVVAPPSLASCKPLSLEEKTMPEPELLVQILSPSNVKDIRANVSRNPAKWRRLP
jgi:hypothetical protein